MEIEVGVTAPVFSLPDENGQTHNLKDYFGNTVLLYFYPKDDTPGCTTEACNFRMITAPIRKLVWLSLV
jgi:peroxiredoxin Q/BCP